MKWNSAHLRPSEASVSTSPLSIFCFSLLPIVIHTWLPLAQRLEHCTSKSYSPPPSSPKPTSSLALRYMCWNAAHFHCRFCDPLKGRQTSMALICTSQSSQEHMCTSYEQWKKNKKTTPSTQHLDSIRTAEQSFMHAGFSSFYIWQVYALNERCQSAVAAGEGTRFWQSSLQRCLEAKHCQCWKPKPLIDTSKGKKK